jgi:ribosomal-protein-alanine N-acetyltransferase
MSSLHSFHLERAGLSDLSDLRVIEKACFPLDAWPLLELIGVLMMPNLVRIKAVIKERMVGFISGEQRRLEGVGWISTIAVLPQYQRLGIANALLDRCENEMGFPVVKLTVRRSNLAAQSLYASRGYRQVDVWASYYQGGEDGLVLQKNLPQPDREGP